MPRPSLLPTLLPMLLPMQLVLLQQGRMLLHQGLLVPAAMIELALASPQTPLIEKVDANGKPLLRIVPIATATDARALNQGAFMFETVIDGRLTVMLGGVHMPTDTGLVPFDAALCERLVGEGNAACRTALKAAWSIRHFVWFMFTVSLGFAAALGLLLFDVHTVNLDNDGGFPTYSTSSSMWALRNTTYYGTGIGPTDMTFAFGDLWRSLHTVIDISWYGNKGDAELAGVLEV